jgi:hypothetical protein
MINEGECLVKVVYKSVVSWVDRSANGDPEDVVRRMYERGNNGECCRPESKGSIRGVWVF